MPDCIFCAIAGGDIPTDALADTGATMAFRDMSPKADTHVLVIPKQHYANLAEVAAADPALVGALVGTAADVASRLGLAEQGYRLIANTGSGAGQTVFHAHLHLLSGRDLPGF